jgi:hypothetical protein
MQHLLIARDGAKWAAWHRDASDVPWSSITAGNRLQPVAETAIDAMSETTALTFSSRQHDVVSKQIAEFPGDLAAVSLGVKIDILMPEGRHPDDDRWSVCYRDPKSGRLYSFGLTDAFRAHTLKARIVEWFDRAPWASFGPLTRNRPETVPPPWERELYVRPEWSARRICPGDFPEFRPWPTPGQHAPVPAR